MYRSESVTQFFEILIETQCRAGYDHGKLLAFKLSEGSARRRGPGPGLSEVSGNGLKTLVVWNEFEEDLTE